VSGVQRNQMVDAMAGCVWGWLRQRMSHHPGVHGRGIDHLASM